MAYFILLYLLFFHSKFKSQKDRVKTTYANVATIKAAVNALKPVRTRAHATRLLLENVLTHAVLNA